MLGCDGASQIRYMAISRVSSDGRCFDIEFRVGHRLASRPRRKVRGAKECSSTHKASMYKNGREKRISVSEGNQRTGAS